ncbi:MAG: hypothetical protein OEW00_04395 [candidate division Zixibacteria bacterium]|nr:hypothetical protein [candidate division Zixibacteria bacterium]
MSTVEIKDFDESRMDELLAFLTRWSPDHPELGEGPIIKWQKCYRFVALHEDKIVGYIAQIPHEFRYGAKSGREGIEKFGWAVTLVLNMGDDAVRKQAGRGLLTRCENNPPWQYCGVGMVPEVEEPYKRRGHAVRRDCAMMYTRILNPSKMLRYVGKSPLLSPAVAVANLFRPAPAELRHGSVEKITEFKPEWDDKWDELLSEQHELYGARDAEFLNYKLAQPNRDYHAYVHSDGGYIIIRHATHRVRDMNLVKVCDLVGTKKAQADLLTRAVLLAREVNAYGIVAMGSTTMRETFQQAGLWVSKPYPIAMPPNITAKMHISFFDSDLDNLW